MPSSRAGTATEEKRAAERQPARPTADEAEKRGPAPAGNAGRRPAPRPRPAPAGSGRGRTNPGLVRPTPRAKVRKARLLVSKVDPWSVLKMSFLLSVALGIMTVVCAVMLWSAMDLTGIFDRINELLAQILGDEGGGFAVQEMVTLGQVASFATIIAVINVVVLTVISMLAAVLYNISASLVGGVGVTLTDD
nr:DUF3566 domain-containing protein [Nesterenkonia sp. GX14115]